MDLLAANAAVQVMDAARVIRACERLADACFVVCVVQDASEPRSPGRAMVGVDCPTARWSWLPRPGVLQRIDAMALVEAVARGC